jgi:hypothetical protein
MKLDDVPPTPGLKSEDIEKGVVETKSDKKK